jgi:hypothetical protein
MEKISKLRKWFWRALQPVRERRARAFAMANPGAASLRIEVWANGDHHGQVRRVPMTIGEACAMRDAIDERRG